jgi:hypothetical protein
MSNSFWIPLLSIMLIITGIMLILGSYASDHEISRLQIELVNAEFRVSMLKDAYAVCESKK